MNCKEKKICANYVQDSIKCTFFYDWCKTRKDIENARINLAMKDRAERLIRFSGREDIYVKDAPRTRAYADITGKLKEDCQ